MSCLIYQWLSDSGYFIHALFPGATTVDAAIDDTAADILAQLPVATDVFAFHLNCTLTARFPREREALVRELDRRGVRVLNANATDMSKGHVHRVCERLGLGTLLASREGDPDETIIVKTDLNFGGDSEWALSDDERLTLGIARGSDIIWRPNDYRVIPRREVNEAWWDDDRLVCERFVTNAAGLWYRAFLFDHRLALCELRNDNAIKKVGESTVARVSTSSDQSHEERAAAGMMHAMLRFAHEFGLDFGTIDAVVGDDGLFYIIDVNTTAAYNYPIARVTEFFSDR